jgi:hypothetical protein
VWLTLSGDITKHISSDEFLDVISIYKIKYGKPTSKSGFSSQKNRGTFPLGCKQCIFENDSVNVSLNFDDRADEKDERYGPSSLVINYSSKKILEKKRKKDLKDFEDDKKMRENNIKETINDL